MGLPLEVACRRFAVLSGIRQEPDNYATCVLPGGATGQRKGLLALVTEPAGEHPALATEACRLVHDVILRQYYTDHSLSLTSSLLKALDSANSALLEYNHQDETPAPEGRPGVVALAVQTGSVRTRRAQVGLTALLLHPDGVSAYIAQMSPTQAYMVHNGLLSALPEPAGWQPRPGKVEVMLKRVLNPGEEGEDEEATEEEEAQVEPLPAMLPSLPLGSGPGAEVDLLYRRVEPGDLLVVVSSSLARHLDRPLAEQIFSSGDADIVTEALHNLATERGLAQSHACVLQLGVEVTSGVDTDFTAHIAQPQVGGSSASGGARYEPGGAETHHPHALLDVLRPAQWFQRRGAPASEQAGDELAMLDDIPPELPHSLHPTQVLLNRTIEVPPYKAEEQSEPEPETQAELEFDGWEDMPPALGDQGQQPGMGSITPVEAPATDAGEQVPHDFPVNTATSTNGASHSNVYRPPQLFPDYEDAEDEEGPVGIFTPPTSKRELPSLKSAAAFSQRAGAWFGVVLKSMLPDSKPETATGTGGSRQRLLLSTRLLIVAGVVVLIGMLSLSVLAISNNSKKAAVNTYLTKAQQEELLANQLTTSPAERQQHLQTALEQAKQALVVDPRSAEAALLVQKAQAALDTLQGITRLQLKLLFDLDDADKAAAASAQQGDSAPAASGAITNTGQLAGVVVQGNDAYVLDKEKGRVYRCRLAAHDCAVALKADDTAGGQKVGSPMAMTMRVGSLVMLDSNLVAYIFSADTSAWQAQPLGGDGAKRNPALDKPKDIASYDGNLYLLASKPGQISRYVGGRYSETPDDWIKDPASADQVKNPLAMGIDGSIYVLLADGRILVMEGGKVARTLTPKLAGDPGAYTQLFTSTDTQDLYLFNPVAGSIVRANKEGQTKAIFMNSAGAGTLSGMTVDEGRGKLYVLQGRRVYEASLSAMPARTNSLAPTDPAIQSQPVAPDARPTIAP